MLKAGPAILLSILTIATYTADANWQLNPQSSSLSFTSVKNTIVGENHSFTQLNGQVDEHGKATLIISLNSVNTGIPIRDERMRDILFESKKSPNAIFSTQLDLKKTNTLSIGEQLQQPIRGELQLHGQKKIISTDVLITRLDKNAVQVSSLKPVIINAKDFNLVPGIDTLQKIAGLQHISLAVPVNFSLGFKNT